MLARIFYRIESDGDGRYLLTFDHSDVDLDETILDKLDSFSFTSDGHMSYKNKFANPLWHFVRQIEGSWSTIWNTMNPPIVPLFNIINAADYPELKQFDRPIFIYFTNKTMDIHQWLDTITDDLSMVTKLYLADVYEGVITKDPHMVRAAIRQRHNKAYLDKQQQEKYDCISRMHHWYKNDAKEIIQAAKDEITNFVITKKYDKRIPDFLVVPSYHIQRYHKAVRLLIEKYDLAFIMSLPVTINGKNYTILFPVLMDNKYPGRLTTEKEVDELRELL